MSERKSIWDSIIGALHPIHPDGYKFIALSAVIALILLWLFPPLGWLAVLLTAAITFFFRDPRRVTPVEEGLIIAPADGRVVAIRRRVPPRELGLEDVPMHVISTFLSVFDVHVVRAPASGRIVVSRHDPGLFMNAESDAASEHNERQSMLFHTESGEHIGVVLIAGMVARRIVTFAGEGDSVQAGQRIALIRFGSRVDVYVPADRSILVAEGQRMIAGETVLADRRSERDMREVRVS